MLHLVYHQKYSYTIIISPQHHQLSYTAIQPKPLPQAKQPSTTETQAQQIKLSPRAAGTASRITSQHKPYPRQQELPESEDHHDKYYTTSDPSIIVPLHTQQPKTNGLANNSPRISARSRSRKYHKDTRLDIQDSNPQSPHSVEEQPHIDRMANDTMTSESFLQAKQRIVQDARGISDPKVIVPAAISTSHNALSSNKSPNARERGRDEIVAPSLQSGGVPEPTPYYLAQSLVPSVICPNLQPILVVIDLNGTILHRGGRSRTEFIERPFAQQFLNYMFHNFIVMIWSSARPENTYAMCNRILPPDQLRRTAAVWGRDRFGLTTSDYTRRVQVYKRLNSVWADSSIAMKHPYFDNCQEWNQTNTILIDDSREKGRSDPFNLLPVPEFVGAMEDPDILRKVAEYLDLAKFQTNVSSFMRSYPFDVSKIHVNRCAEELERM